MYNANTLVHRFYSSYWKRFIEPANKQTKAFTFSISADSQKSIPMAYDIFAETLEHLAVNSMAAYSGTEDEGMLDIVESPELWSRDPPGKLSLRTCDIGDTVVIDFEDNGSGINPELIYAQIVNEGVSTSAGLQDKYALLDIIFKRYFTTKPSGGEGLAEVRKNIESCGGKVYVLGTCYNTTNKASCTKRDLKAIGAHHRNSTGTIMRIEFNNK